MSDSDYTILNPGTGGDSIAVDNSTQPDGTNIKIPVSRLVTGPEGTNGQIVTDAVPMPTTDTDVADRISRLEYFLRKLLGERVVGRTRIRAESAAIFDTAHTPLSSSRDANLLLSRLAEGQELSSRRKMFSASVGVAGVAPGTALTATAPFAILNPTNSGVACVIRSIWTTYRSGTLGAGDVFLCQGTAPAAAPAGFLTTFQVGLLNGRQVPAQCACRAYSGTSLTNVPTVLRPMFSTGPALATTADGIWVNRHAIGGDVIVMPGAYVAVEMIGGAGTTPRLCYGATWYEIPLQLVEN